MAKPGHRGLIRIFRATRYSLQGLAAAWRHEASFRQETVLVLLLLPLAVWLGETALEHAVLLGSLFIVIIVELVNSAIEAAIDRHGDERHELSGRAKDLSSAAVLLSLLMLAVVWGLIAAERLLSG